MFNAYEKLRNEETNVEEMMEATRDKLKEVLGLHKDTGIFLTSSEQDAQYIPILIAKAIGSANALNVIVREELFGKDTVSAACGRYYSDSLPIKGYCPEDANLKNKPVEGLSHKLETACLKSFDRDGQSIIDTN